MDIAFTGTVVTTLDGVIKQAAHAVSVVLIIFGCIDPSLRGDTMCPAWTVMEGEAFDVVSEFTQRSGGCGTCETCTNDDDFETQFIIGGHQGHGGFIFFPFGIYRAGRNFAI